MAQAREKRLLHLVKETISYSQISSWVCSEDASRGFAPYCSDVFPNNVNGI